MNIRITPSIMRREAIEAAVRKVMMQNPPQGGLPPTDEQVRTVLAAFMAANPVPAGKDGKAGARGADGVDGADGHNGRDGKDGVDGHSVTEAQYTAAVEALWNANPPKNGVDGKNGVEGKDGIDGTNGKDATQLQVNQAVANQIGAAVATWLQANPVMPDVSVKVGAVFALAAGQAPKVENVGTDKDLVLNFGIPVGAPGTNGSDGAKGNPGNTGPAGDTRVKYAKSNLVTNASGVYTAALGGAGTFTSTPAIVIQARGTTAKLVHSYTLSGTPATGLTITVTFSQMRDSVNVAILGLVQLTVGVTAPISFDLIAMEQT